MILNSFKNINDGVFLLGYGFWGKKLYLTLRQLGQKVVVFDLNSNQSDGIEVQSIDTLDEYLSKYSSQHFFIASPEQTHFDLAKKILSFSNHVFVEKPLSLRKDEAQKMADIATEKKVNLFVDHVFLYDDSWRMIKRHIPQLGKIKKVTSVRHSNNISKTNLSVFDDLVPHDIYLFHDLFNHHPQNSDIEVINKKGDQIVDAKLRWEVERINWENWYSWNSYPTERTFTIIGEKGKIIWDKGDTNDTLEISIGQENKILPIIKQKSSLDLMIKDFFHCSKQESSTQREQRYSSYIQEVGVLESIRHASSTLQSLPTT